MPAVYPLVVLPTESFAPTGEIHVPSGPSSPTFDRSPACTATHTCTLPSCEADDTVSGTRSSVPACTYTFSCTGVSTMDPLLPAETTSARPGLFGPT